MFAGLINQAKSAVSGLVLKYVARASVAVPFVIAAGFALAALTVMLVERFGHVTAYWLLAGGLAAIGIIAAIVVSVKEHEEEKAEQLAEHADTGEDGERCDGPGDGADTDRIVGIAPNHQGRCNLSLERGSCFLAATSHLSCSW